MFFFGRGISKRWGSGFNDIFILEMVKKIKRCWETCYTIKSKQANTFILFEIHRKKTDFLIMTICVLASEVGSSVQIIKNMMNKC